MGQMLYSICQRYNFESNLQRLCKITCGFLGCIRYVKDTILKAIYNICVMLYHNIALYSICQRYNFESNLQPISPPPFIIPGCIRYVKDTILKAIYNPRLGI